MKVFLAGCASNEEVSKYLKNVYFLESFYYIKDWQKKYITNTTNFLLDSGAFTFMNNFKGKIDWKDYIDKYIKFINDYNIKYFFELDIDVIVGYENVKKIRKYIETKTNKKCIPVWHKSRGLEEWIKLTKEYNYIAIGGFVIREIKRKDYKYITELLKIARENNCKVHGLGFTNIKGIKKYHFYSVDSTNWSCGSRYANFYVYKNGDIKDILGSAKIGKMGKRISKEKVKKLNIHNFTEWVKFQEYADKQL